MDKNELTKIDIFVVIFLIFICGFFFARLAGATTLSQRVRTNSSTILFQNASGTSDQQVATYEFLFNRFERLEEEIQTLHNQLQQILKICRK